jgi:hypothetical protein
MLRILRTLWLCTWGFISVCTAGHAATTVTLSSDKSSVAYGGGFALSVRIVTDVAACPAYGAHGPVTIEVDGVAVLPSDVWYYAPSSTCWGDVYMLDLQHTDYDVPLGSHAVTVAYTPDGASVPAARSDPVMLAVLPLASATTDAGMVKAGIMDQRPGFSMTWYCSAKSVQVHGASPVAPPGGTTLAPGVVEYQASGCYVDCGFLCPPYTPEPQQRVQVTMPTPIPSGARFWSYSTGPGVPALWLPLTAVVEGNAATFFVAGGYHQAALSGYIAMSVAEFSPQVADLWWAGPAENGWGMSISQNADRLFIGLFIYRSDGTPLWVVIPGGTWNEQHTVFTGDIYQPSGSWFLEYDASRLAVGTSIGKGTLTFASDRAATFDYTINGASGRKSMQRQAFGDPATASKPRYGGMWWGGDAQRGWGLAMAQQGDALFSVWFTYDRSGAPTWFVMPAGTWMSPAPSAWSFTGPLYRTTGSPWIGGPYDASRLAVVPVGTMTFSFGDVDHAAMDYTVDCLQCGTSIERQPF